MSVADFWRSNETLAHITAGNKEWPEGDWIAGLGRMISGKFPGLPVVELGCGYGRLAPFFSPDEYIGLDINPAAIAEARKRQPHYKFSLDDGELPTGGVYLLWTVALHVPDEELEAFLDRIKEAADAVVIGEMMGREWRRNGKPPAFNREAGEYAFFMLPGFKCAFHDEPIYEHYGKPMDIMGFARA